MAPQFARRYSEADREHGLIMGFVVTGTRPAGASDPPPAAEGKKPPTAASGPDDGGAAAVRALLWLPRFLLGNLGGVYYAVLPVFVYVKNELCGGSALSRAAAGTGG